MQYLGHTPTTAYTTTIKQKTTNFLPQVVQNSVVRTGVVDNYPVSNTLRRSLTCLPWKPSNYYTAQYGIPSVSLSHSHVTPLSARNALTELEGIKVPPLFSAARNALYTRYTPNDWLNNSVGNLMAADRGKEYSEGIRFDTLRLCKETHEKTQRTQDDVSKKLGDRINDITFWKKELENEIDNMTTETNKLNETKRQAETLLAESENPLHVGQECLYNREKRQGIDLVHDHVEKCLLSEIDAIRTCQDRLRNVIAKATKQANLNRAAQHELLQDNQDKFSCQQLDEAAHSLNNQSAGINMYDKIETIDNCVTVPETWAKFTNNNIKRSQAERDSSKRIREEIESTVTECRNDMWNKWNRVNTALTERVQETTDTRNKTQQQLSKVIQEIFDMDSTIEYLKKCIHDKSKPLMVAQTRLNTRLYRPKMELCRDEAQCRLVEEVHELKETVEQLQRRLSEAENSLQILLRNKATLEHDLGVKNNSLFIDRENCLGVRKTFTIAPRMLYV